MRNPRPFKYLHKGCKFIVLEKNNLYYSGLVIPQEEKNFLYRKLSDMEAERYKDGEIIKIEPDQLVIPIIC